jgi:DnaJ family protein A protein 2
MFFPGFPGMNGDFLGAEEPVDTAGLYETLGLQKGASESEVKTAYRKLAKQYHPDKIGGDAAKFREINEAYNILSDPEKQKTVRSSRPMPRKKTQDLVHPLKVSLEQLYTGASKKLAVPRQVVDQKKGVKECQTCAGKGATTEVLRMGPMTQHVQAQCRSCDGSGKAFSMKQEREVLGVHIQKGAPDGHKVHFREMADEHPGKDTGDVVFVLKEQEHPEFKRKGADLFIERKISLVEALCGFSLELMHLDGRKLIIKTSPGEIIRPMVQGYDPLAKEEDSKTEWEAMEGFDCPDVDTVAQAEITDVDTLKKACEMQLKRKGIDVGAFVVDSRGACFKQCTREEALAARKPRQGSTMYVVSDPAAKRSLRLMKAVKGEGMPTFKNPFIHGNLFLNLTIQFPERLSPEVQGKIQGLLPPPLNVPTWKEDDQSVEVHTLVDIDPVESHDSNKVNMRGGGEAYDEEEDSGASGPAGMTQNCRTM